MAANPSKKTEIRRYTHRSSGVSTVLPALRLDTVINVKMPTFVGILTFISMINTALERLKAKFFIYRYFSFYEQLKFHAQFS